MKKATQLQLQDQSSSRAGVHSKPPVTAGHSSTFQCLHAVPGLGRAAVAAGSGWAAAAAAGLPDLDLERRAAAAAAMAMCCGRAATFAGGSSPAAWARLDASIDSSCRSRVDPACNRVGSHKGSMRKVA